VGERWQRKRSAQYHRGWVKHERIYHKAVFFLSSERVWNKESIQTSLEPGRRGTKSSMEVKGNVKNEL
jgi:hypothetical protein